MLLLFLSNDLRIADVHEIVEQCLTTLPHFGLGTTNVNSGYGRSFDFVMDGVINALEIVAATIEKLVEGSVGELSGWLLNHVSCW
ncbi:hypothetical protein D3874_04340 [Oleomonas cavernae]|uniref:Uncharacterized protein n=1 Tax=Oleomonas cavernae TaxID=2320859 RepID=A0A418W8L5_9PROT|nr:hypothetical protein [Oleomonas cavernae]RJF86349.1 hypothetical protein D3874_04340 [Oleomonas cavernae]